MTAEERSSDFLTNLRSVMLGYFGSESGDIRERQNCRTIKEACSSMGQMRKGEALLG